MYKDITELYCFVDDFCNAVDQYQAKHALDHQDQRKPTRVSAMRVSEILTIMVLSSIKNFKHFYCIFLNLYQKDFPHLISYTRFVDLQKRSTYSFWFFGFKLHLVINEKGEIQSALLTAGNVDDRVHVDDLTKRLKGLLLGDKGYIKQPLFEVLYKRGLKLITPLKEKMKNKLMIMKEKVLLKKRSIIETVFDLRGFNPGLALIDFATLSVIYR